MKGFTVNYDLFKTTTGDLQKQQSLHSRSTVLLITVENS